MTAPGSTPPPAPGWWVKRNRVAFPPPCEMTLTGFPPFLGTGFTLTPAACSMTLTGFAPTLLTGQVLTPAACSMTLTGYAPGVSQASASLSIVGSGAANGATVTIPTHQVGDLIVIFAYRNDSTSVPSKPSAGGTVPAYVDIDAPAGSDGASARSAQFVATATTTTSGTWTNATSMAVIVTRGQNASPIGGHALTGGTAIGQAVAPSITLTDTSGASMILEFYGQGNTLNGVNPWDAAPGGYTRRAAFDSGTPFSRVCLNTKNVTTTDGSVTQTGDTFFASQCYRGATIEILD